MKRERERERETERERFFFFLFFGEINFICEIRYVVVIVIVVWCGIVVV